MTEQTEALGELLRNFRSRAGLSQDDLARSCRVSVRTLSDIESGSARAPRASTLQRIGDALSLGPQERARLIAAARAAAYVSSGRTTASRPRARTTLIGRDNERAEARALLKGCDGIRLLTLIGPPGVGKTALALTIADDLADAFDGVLTVELAALPSAELVASKVAIAAGLRRMPAETPARSIATALRTRRMLLVLDNFEHVTEAAPFVAELLAASPTTVVLTTSRAPLRLSWERTMAVQPLAAAPAVRMLLERVRDLDPTFLLTSEQAKETAHLTHVLGGLPLAIELAASMLATHSFEDVVAQFASADALGLASPDGGRHGSMRAAIASTHRLLSPEHQVAFRRLAVLHGPFTVAAARAVIAGREDDDADMRVLAVLERLTQHNLMRASEHYDAACFEFFPFIREYAETLLAAAREDAPTYERLISFCIGVVSVLHDPSAQSAANLDDVELESTNINTGLDWARRSGRSDLAWRLAHATHMFWNLRHPSLGLVWMRRLLEDAEHDANSDEAAVAQGYLRATLLANQAGHLTLADALSTEARARLERLGDLAGLASVISAEGVRARDRRDHHRARELLEMSLEMRRKLGLAHLVAATRFELAGTALAAGDDAGAAEHLERCLPEFRATGSDYGTALTLSLLARIAAQAGRTNEARALCHQALSIATPIRNVSTAVHTQLILSDLALREDALDDAERNAREALELCAATDVRAPEPDCIEALAAVLFARGDATGAARALGAASVLREHEPMGAPASDLEAHSDLVSRVRSTLGAEAFEGAFEAGQRHGMSETV